MPDSIMNDASLMRVLGREMTRAVQRSAIASGNLANAETPGYRTKEVQFAEALDGQLGGLSPMATHTRHLGAPNATGAGTVVDAEGKPASRDGNNVQLEHELLELSRSGSDFAAAQTVLAAKFRLVRYAINEGR